MADALAKVVNDLLPKNYIDGRSAEGRGKEYDESVYIKRLVDIYRKLS